MLANLPIFQSKLAKDLLIVGAIFGLIYAWHTVIVGDD